MKSLDATIRQEAHLGDGSAFKEISIGSLPKGLLEEASASNEFKKIHRASKVSVEDNHDLYALETERHGIKYIFFVDHLEGQMAGFTEIKYSGRVKNISDDEDLVYAQVAFTYTKEDSSLENRGLAKNRLVMAAEYVRSRFGYQLYSDSGLGDTAHHIWHTLIEAGLAERVDNGAQYYRFKK